MSDTTNRRRLRVLRLAVRHLSAASRTTQVRQERYVIASVRSVCLSVCLSIRLSAREQDYAERFKRLFMKRCSINDIFN